MAPSVSWTSAAIRASSPDGPLGQAPEQAGQQFPVVGDEGLDALVVGIFGGGVDERAAAVGRVGKLLVEDVEQCQHALGRRVGARLK
jgi:hypothetical protein